MDGKDLHIQTASDVHINKCGSVGHGGEREPGSLDLMLDWVTGVLRWSLKCALTASISFSNVLTKDNLGGFSGMTFGDPW